MTPVKGLFNYQRCHDPQGENHWSRGWKTTAGVIVQVPFIFVFTDNLPQGCRAHRVGEAHSPGSCRDLVISNSPALRLEVCAAMDGFVLDVSSRDQTQVLMSAKRAFNNSCHFNVQR